MQEILFGYKLNPTTWAYISALMMVGVYFKFRRFWSVRNLDLMALMAFSPGLLLVYYGLLKNHPELIQNGYIWLFTVGGFFFIRLLLDSVMVRRPLLEPNLSASGLTFTGAALLVFLMANVITSPKERLEYELAEQEVSLAKQKAPVSPSPGYPAFQEFAGYSNQAMTAPVPAAQPEARHAAMMRAAASHTVVILAHLALVAGLVWIGYRHFDNVHTGVAASTLYLLSFYTSQLTSQVDHVVPGMLLVWAVAAYRRPLLAGALIGLAAGLIYYPLFLLPLWCGFYWRRGVVRFAAGVVLALGILVALLPLAPHLGPLAEQARLMFGCRDPFNVQFVGFWKFFEAGSMYRIPVLAAFVAICISLAIWPAHKNFGTLLSCTAAVMLATQFWHAHQGGLYMGWYLPLLILTIFRPNLEDRVALSAVKPAWGRRRKA